MANVSRLSLVLGLALSTAAAAASATEKVSIKLTDGDSTRPGMSVVATPEKVKAGRIEFDATNTSGQLVHELLVVRDSERTLPYDAKHDRVDERKLGVLADLGDLKPGARRVRAVTLKPGTYLLLCNEPGHYHAGMFTKLVVERN